MKFKMPFGHVKLFLTTILIVGATACVSQKIVIQNNAELFLTVGRINPQGPANYNSGVALIANMQFGIGAEARYCHRLYKGLYLGASVGYGAFSKWQDGQDNTFAGTTVAISSAAPVIQFRTHPSIITGIGKFSLFAAVAPGIYRIVTTTDDDSEINAPDLKNSLIVKSNRFGYELSAGVNYVYSSSFGFTLSASYNSITTDSHVYLEKEFNYLVVRAGFFYRLFQHENYKY